MDATDPQVAAFLGASRPVALGMLTAIVGCTSPSQLTDEKITLNVTTGKLFYTRFRNLGQLEDLEDAISSQRKAVELTMEEDINFSMRCINLGASLLARAQRTMDSVHVLESVSFHLKTIPILEKHDLHQAFGMYHNLASTFQCSFECTGNINDLNESIANRQNCIDLAPKNFFRLPDWQSDLPVLMARRFDITRDADHIDEALVSFAAALDAIPATHPLIPQVHYNCSLAYLQKLEVQAGQTTSNAAFCLERAIGSRQRAVRLARQLTPNDPDISRWAESIGVLFLRRYDVTNDICDLEEGNALLQEALPADPIDDSTQKTFGNLSVAAFQQFQHTQTEPHLEAAIAAQKRALAHLEQLGQRRLLSELERSQLAVALTRLAILLSNRFDRNGELSYLQEAVSAHEDAFTATPEDAPEFADIAVHLGNTLLTLFLRTGNEQDLDRAIQMHERALLLTKQYADDNRQGMCELSLGNSLARRFERNGDTTDIDIAISYQMKALDRTPEHLLDNGRILNSLSISFTLRFEHTGDISDIARAITCLRDAVERSQRQCSSIDIPSMVAVKHKANLMNSLSIALLRRFEHSRKREDIEEAVLHQRKVVDITGSSDPLLPARLNNLGNFLLAQFGQSNEVANVYEAIAAHRRAVGLSIGHADHAHWLHNLGHSLLQLCEREESDMSRFDEAISTLERATEFLPNDHASLPRWLNTLGTSYTGRFKMSKQSSDLDKAIHTHDRAITLTQDGDIHVVYALHALGSALNMRFLSNGMVSDLHKTIYHQRRAVSTTPDTHAGRPRFLLALGHSLEHLASTLPDEDLSKSTSIEEARACFREGATSEVGAISDKLENAIAWAFMAVRPDTPGRPLKYEVAMDAFETAVKLLAIVAGLDQTTRSRHETLSQYMGLVQAAAATAFGCGKPETALEWLEEGRCLVWSQLNGLRTPVEELRSYDKVLADRFVFLSTSLESLSSRSSSTTKLSIAEGENPSFVAPGPKDSMTIQEETYCHVAFSNEWTELLCKIRDVAQFSNFLRPPTASSLLEALPHSGPIVLINIHGFRCDALALLPNSTSTDDLLHIPLPGLSFTQVEYLRKRLQDELVASGVRERSGQGNGLHRIQRAIVRYRAKTSTSIVGSVLAELWTLVVKPILDALAIQPSECPTTRVWWCPTGPLTSLPLHAAGIYTKGGAPSTIFDYVISSYIPTVMSLTTALAVKPSSVPKAAMLVVSVPNAPGLRMIPGTDLEAITVKRLAESKNIDVTILQGANATVDSTVDLMEKHTHIHLACHASQDSSEPLQSRFALSDSGLDLSTLIKRNLRLSGTLDLAFLSACQTSTGDMRLSEEAVHLAAGMMAVGYRGVVATMWSIPDKYAPEVAEDFYKSLFDRKETENGRCESGPNAASALHHAVRKLSRKLPASNSSLLAWVPYVHFGV